MTRNYLSGSIKKALIIIECVGKSPNPLKASQVASLTKLDRATRFMRGTDTWDANPINTPNKIPR